MKIIIINGPNLNLLGSRQTQIYGNTSFDVYLQQLKSEFSEIQIDSYQSNIEGDIINKLHETGFSYDGIVLNAGGYTHTSVSIADAVAAITTPVIEIHISNIFNRESFRQHSLISSYCKGSIIGFGLLGYRLAILSFI